MPCGEEISFKQGLTAAGGALQSRASSVCFCQQAVSGLDLFPASRTGWFQCRLAASRPDLFCQHAEPDGLEINELQICGDV